MTKRLFAISLVVPCLAMLVGCGGGGGIEVTGKVTFDGEPLSGVDVRFIPDGAPGNEVTGFTDKDGVYTLKTPQGATDIAPGKYRVVLSRLLQPDGTPLPPDSEIDPMSANAKESLPPEYSSDEQTTLTAKVTDGSGPIDFPLTSKPAPK